MGRREQPVVYLDTHVVVWLYAGLTENLSDNAKKAIENCEVLISQIVRLELQFLFEIARIKARPSNIISKIQGIEGRNWGVINQIQLEKKLEAW